MIPDRSQEKPRALARRRQVLDAASVCFRRYGFHAASMAQVAAEAGMSVGHIYRYFTGKEQIIAAIVREDVDRIMATLSNMPSDPQDLRAKLIELAEQGVADATDPDRSGLLIEIRAEAARNPAIRKIIGELDTEIDQHVTALVQKAIGVEIDAADLAARVEMFALIFQGLSLRSVINPEMDRAALIRLVRIVIDMMLRLN